MRTAVVLIFFILQFLSTVSFADGNLNYCERGIKISKIKFVTDINLTYSDLIRNLNLKVGEPCDLSKIEYAVSQLRRRNIFETVTHNLEGGPNDLTLVFKLIPFLVLSEVEFSGNQSVSASELLRNSGLKIGSQVFAEDIRESERRISRYYSSLGFPKIEIDSRLIADRTAPLVSLEFNISEGRENTVNSIDFNEEIGDAFSELKADTRLYFTGKPIDRKLPSELKKFVFQQLASLKYYQASVFVDILDEKEGKLFVKIKPKERIVININGASFLSDQQLLDKLDLESRTVPLRIGALNQWCQDIITSYHSYGYLDAKVSCVFPKKKSEEVSFEKEIQVSIEEGERYSGTKILFEGNYNYSKEKLQSVIISSLKVELSDLLKLNYTILEEDLPSLEQALKSFYLKEGFLDVEVSSNFSLEKSSRTIKIEFLINEGKRYFLSSLKLETEGSDAKKELVKDLSDELQSYLGDAYQLEKIAQELRDFEKKGIKRGFSQVELYPVYLKESEQLKIDLLVGDKIKIRKILTGGNFFTLDHIILRELKFKSGDYYNPELLEDSRRALLGLGIFKSVEIYPVNEGAPEQQTDIQVMVKERETGVLEGLIEVSTQDGLHLQGQVGQRNLFGAGKALVLSLDGYFKEHNPKDFDAGRARAAFGSPKIFSSILDYQLEGFFQTNLNLNQTFKYDRVGGSNSLKFPILETFRFSFGHTAYTERLYDVVPEIAIGSRDVGTTTYSGLTSVVEYDMRDDPFISTRGYRLEVGGGLFPDWLGSEVSLFKAHAQATKLIPVTNFWTYAINLRGAATRSYGDYESVPLGSRYFIGGRDTLRGYSRYQVGARSTNGVVAGGDTMLTLNQELRYQLSDQLVGFVFIDVGQSFLVQEGSFEGDTKTDFSSLKYSPGFGAQYLTPIGPLSFELGFATEREYGERWGRFIVSIGSAF